jgi:hypothetical protein
MFKYFLRFSIKGMDQFAGTILNGVKFFNGMILKLKMSQGSILVTDHGRFNEVDNQKRDCAGISILQRLVILCADVSFDPDNIDLLLL